MSRMAPVPLIIMTLFGIWGCETSTGGGSAQPCNKDGDCPGGGKCVPSQQQGPLESVSGGLNGCECDYFENVCEAAAKCSDQTCGCDPDCSGLETACKSDAHCDSWCPTDEDPDCSGDDKNGKYCTGSEVTGSGTGSDTGNGTGSGTGSGTGNGTGTSGGDTPGATGGSDPTGSGPTGGTGGLFGGNGGTPTQSYAGYCTYPVASGTSGNQGGVPATGGVAPQGCADVSGTWTIDQHCEADMVGDDFDVSQSGCALTVPAVGWTGTVTAAGGLTLGGPAGGNVLTCTGTVSQSHFSVDCQPGGCHVEMSK